MNYYSRAFNYEELVNLIPDFIESQMRDLLKEKIDLRQQTIHSRELECANSFLNSENIITILWGLDIYRRYFDTFDYSPFQQRNMDLDYKFIIPKMIQIARTSNIPLIIYEALYNLNELTKYSEQVQQFIENQGLILFNQSLQSPYLIITNQAVRGIFNILRYHQQYRKYAQQLEIIPILTDTIDRNETLEKIDLSISALNMLCEENNFEQQGQAGLNLMKNILNTFCKTIQRCQKLNKNQIIDLCFDGLLIPIRESLYSQNFLMETGFITYVIHQMGDYKASVFEKVIEIFGEIIIQGKRPQITQQQQYIQNLEKWNFWIKFLKFYQNQIQNNKCNTQQKIRSSLVNYY